MLLCQVLVWWFRFDIEDRRFAPPGLLIPGSPLLPRWSKRLSCFSVLSKRLSCFSVAFTMHVSCDPCAGRIALIGLRWSGDTFPCPWRILIRQEQVPPLIRSSCQGKGFCHCLLCGWTVQALLILVQHSSSVALTPSHAHPYFLACLLQFMFRDD